MQKCHVRRYYYRNQGPLICNAHPEPRDRVDVACIRCAKNHKKCSGLPSCTECWRSPQQCIFPEKSLSHVSESASFAHPQFYPPVYFAGVSGAKRRQEPLSTKPTVVFGARAVRARAARSYTSRGHTGAKDITAYRSILGRYGGPNFSVFARVQPILAFKLGVNSLQVL